MFATKEALLSVRLLGDTALQTIAAAVAMAVDVAVDVAVAVAESRICCPLLAVAAVLAIFLGRIFVGK